MKSNDYRPDIDGLRAVAVIAVMLFHFGVPGLAGGFVGVDIFFVISGYLITGILVGPKRLSVAEFYGRRVRRILPAMLLVIAVSLIAGWFLLLPGDYDSLGKSAAYSSVGFGNYYFLWNTGYFDREAALQPLLHLWSLGVEEQFYLVWPALMLALSRISRGRPTIAVVAISLVAIVSFSTAVHLVATDPKQAFYAPFSRAWELAVGGILVFVPLPRRSSVDWLGCLGLIIIVLSILRLSPDDAFPGVNALAPVFGAALLVWRRSPSPVTAALSFSPLRFTGKISYSLYLWHWPIFVFFRQYADGTLPTAIETGTVFLFTFLAATLSWRYIEEPVRRLQPMPLKAITAGAAAALMVAWSGNAISQAGGFTSRVSDDALAMRSLKVMWDWPCPQTVNIPELRVTYCAFGAPWVTAKHHGILWGDSHADHLAPLIDVVGQLEDTAFFLYEPCPAALGERIYRNFPEAPNYKDRCASSQKAAINMLRLRPDVDVVVLAAAWSGLQFTDIVAADGHQADKVSLVREGLQMLLPEIAAANRRITIVAPTPGPAEDLTSCAVNKESNLLRRRCSTEMNSKWATSVRRPITSALKSLAAENNLSFVDPGPGMCPNDQCTTYVNGEFIYRDASHLRRNLRTQTKEALAKMIGLDAIAERAKQPAPAS
ncbi:acyltransferase [Mesorhizobium sp. B3-2-1]|uniref:acyltransferase family protein n=1 Tax=Mesorhizobium sp. B3-2-1 TaxID=2589891 RepID=UPI00112A7C7B|nr:acyltransferase family protein [Mesorhizobium sp. B3-2-1]TPI19239.1 acyltransferase [Mesorhizobium sp. B3-2-1]